MGLIDFTGKVALVTGGSRGIGAAAARMLGGVGASVAITYHTRKADAERVAGEVRGMGAPGHALVFQADLSREEDNERVIRETVAACGRLDMFVVNAGVWPAQDVPLTAMTNERWRTTIGANLDAVFYGCRAALRVISPGGTVVMVSSTAGQRGEAYHADYAATKGAVISIVKSLAIEAAPRVTVNAVAPGWVDTEMAQEPFERDGGRGRQEIERAIPLKRVASADDIAGPIVFLCSPLARHITGEILNVNGGSVLCG